ncbi:MAG TPA: hypothetical protein VHX86_13475 [Tepidisphaeraceae bacterium]|jgi:hypothetical protein|nr:hypothetical protein [Tepidisphaeraceae bacterium]
MNELLRCGSRQAYQHNKSWIPVMEETTKASCAKLGCETCGEYLKIDRVGYTYGPVGLDDDWNLHIAIEFENGKDWLREFNKLAFVAADLRVLVAYQLDSDRNAERLLKQYLKKHPGRVWKVRRPWLIIFGPHWDLLKTDAWQAHTIDDNCNLIPLECESRLLGTCWDKS